MTTQGLAKFLQRVLKFCLFGILLTPLILPVNLLFPFITGKTIFFRMMVEIAVFFYFWLMLLDKNYRPKMNLISWLVVIFGAIIFLTGLTGVNFYKSFWGTIERGEGFLTISHLIIYFLILTWTFKSKKEWLDYLTSAVVVGVLVEGYAILQKINAQKFLWWNIINSGGGRLTATIGNAAFLGAYTLQIFYLSLLLFFERKHLAGKIFFIMSGLLSLYVLYQTQTRGAFLALAATLPLLALFFIFRRRIQDENEAKKQVKIKFAFLAVLILVIGFGATVWFSRNAAWVKNQPTLYRLVRISRNDITTQSRFLAWDSSWKGWKDRFLVGYGWENYNIAFNKYFHAEIFMDQGSQLWFDRAHNTIFDVAVATGLIGLLVYLAVFVVAWRALLRSKIYFAATRILFIALLAHFLQNIFVFDVLASYLIMFNLFALTVFLTQIKDNHLPAANQQFAVATGGQQTRNEFYLMPMIIVLIFLIFGVYIFNIKPLQANRQSVNALIASAANKEQTAVNIFKMAIDMNTYQTPELRQKLADNILVQNNTQNGLTNEQIAKNYELTIAELKKNINESPWDVQNYLYLMAILNRGVNYDARRFQEVLDWGAKASQLSPTRPQIYFEMGQAYVGMKKYNEAIEAFKKAVELNPRTMESRWNLMAVYVVAGKDSLAQEQYDFMVSRKYNFDDQENLQRLYRIFLIAGQTDKVVIVLEKIAILYPSGENYAKLAAGYAQVGEKEKARAAVTRAVELNPELATEAEKFLQILQ